ncbi:cytochrome P450 [Piedraia hortae CBS 480.64]|uniref:Cytochrome P450 n=1 Tax=Piedraia hortae CBS 480.64 TaxID=1314780 RepID=A0A6A7BW95_9PEZI|nr:cytochrome P450 [Piedraia hortae CBS 480.64]
MSTLGLLTVTSIGGGYLALRSSPEHVGYVLAAVLAVWTAYAVYQLVIYPFYTSPFRNLPEPAEGRYNFPWAHGKFIKSEHNGAPLRRWLLSVPNNGLIRLRVLFNQERILVTSSDAMKEILVTKPYDFQKPGQVSYLFRKLLGDGVLVANGDAHKAQRKALLPAFSYRHIKDLYVLFWQKAKQSTGAIAASARSGKPQSTYEWASRVTLDIIGQSGMGYDFDSLTTPDTELLRTYRILFEEDIPLLRWTIIGVKFPVKAAFALPLPEFVAARRAASAIRAFAHEQVQQKRAKKSYEKDVDILSIAMRSGQFTDDDCVDQMMTFLAAGHETTASAVTWAVYALCNHPQVQNKLREEVRASLPSTQSDDVVTAENIDNLHYLKAVCNEVLRLIPSVPMTARDAVVDTTVQGLAAPKGTRFLLAPWGTNVDPTLWGDDALEFNPERWLKEGQANVGGAANNWANLTFLHGSRSCIGKDFAKGEFACILAAWVDRFEMSWENGKELPMDVKGWVTVRPYHKLPVVFREVEGW